MDSGSSEAPETRQQGLSENIMYISYSVILPTIVSIGIVSNVLNMMTLQSRKLQSVPFLYIKGIAVLDLTALILTLGACLRISGLTPGWYVLVLYQSYVELTLLNTGLIGSIFAATSLTIERYFLICHPYRNYTWAPLKRFRVFMFISIVMSFLLHLPMMAEYQPAYNATTQTYTRIVNEQTDSSEFYFAYKIVREVIRTLAVLVMAVANFIIVLALKKAKERRNRIKGRDNRGESVEKDGVSLVSTSRAGVSTEKAVIRRSVEDKRLTAMMIGMSIIYLVGNIPVAILMTMNEEDEDLKASTAFQWFRIIVNLMEICHHCLNFYIFCISSRDYTQAFLDLFAAPKAAVVAAGASLKLQSLRKSRLSCRRTNAVDAETKGTVEREELVKRQVISTSKSDIVLEEGDVLL